MPEANFEPAFLPVLFENIPMELREGCWAVWVATLRTDRQGDPVLDAEGNPKYNKIPHNGHHRISTADTEGWLLFDQACDLYQNFNQHGEFKGITKLVQKGDLVYADWDAKNLTPEVWQQIDGYYDSYLEVSPSGRGLRGVSISTYKGDRTTPFEVYTGDAPRHLTFTGNLVAGHAQIRRSERIDQWFAGLPEKQRVAAERTTHPPIPDIPIHLPDQFKILGFEHVPDPGQRNERYAKVCTDLLRYGMTKEQVFSWSVHSDWLPLYAADKRNGPESRAIQFLWEEIERVAAYCEQNNPVPAAPAPAPQAALPAPQPAPAAPVPDFLAPRDPQPAAQEDPAVAARAGVQALIDEANNLPFDADVDALLVRTLNLSAADAERVMKAIADRLTLTISAIRQDRARLQRQNFGGENRPRENGFYGNYFWVEGVGRFYRPDMDLFLDQQNFSFTYSHLDDECLQRAREGAVQRVATIDFAPGQPSPVFRDPKRPWGNDHSSLICNLWQGFKTTGIPGDTSKYHNHLKKMCYASENILHFYRYFATVMQHPELKQNHALIFCGPQGNGKNWLLYPLVMALGEGIGGGNHCPIIEGDGLGAQFNRFLVAAKVVIFNESDMEGNKDADRIAERLKRLTASPPDTLNVEPKGVDPFSISNVVCCIMTANSRMPLQVQDGDRRSYATWSPYSPKDPETGEMLPGEEAYWTDLWDWMKGTGPYTGRTPGYEHVIHEWMRFDLTGYNPASPPPSTEFTRNMIDAGRTGLSTLIREVMDRGMLPAIATSNQIRNTLISSADIMVAHGYKLSDPPSTTAISRELGRMGVVHGPIKTRLPSEYQDLQPVAGGQYPRLYIMDRAAIDIDISPSDLVRAWAERSRGWPAA